MCVCARAHACHWVLSVPCLSVDGKLFRKPTYGSTTEESGTPSLTSINCPQWRGGAFPQGSSFNGKEMLTGPVSCKCLVVVLVYPPLSASLLFFFPCPEHLCLMVAQSPPLYNQTRVLCWATFYHHPLLRKLACPELGSCRACCMV